MTATKQQIFVKVEPRDMLRCLALVGSCVATEVANTAAGKPVSLRYFTLRLILRQRPPQGATADTKWTVLVSHAFATDGPQTDPAAQCPDCMAEKCYKCTPGVQWAAEQHDIIGSMSWDVDMSLASWSWGVIASVYDRRVWIQSLALEHKEHLLVENDDCGAILFVIDDLTDANKPVIMPMAVNCVASEPK
ncbi:hypothetical protein FBEOM_6482 [Fusarium beomiforme]|uniref:Uncharacterized protein n=1 Tax=Fusarium beomiforme TaxID=44412 RepID=A0A9P5AJ07_9HYPO|nr:hypothetical protein FBEOM_6482 [Fusarium beomiforme]